MKHGQGGKPSELFLRVVSALILAVLAFGSVWAGGVVFGLFVAAMAFIVFLEWTAIIGLTAFDKARLFTSINFMVLTGILLVFGSNAALAVLVLFAAFSYGIAAKTTRETALWTVVATLYCGFAAISMVGLRNGGGGAEAILLVFAIVWGTDIGAYFVGRKLGGPKLAPHISPGKTRSGAVGGLVVAIACAILIGQLTGFVGVFAAVLIAVFGSIVSQAGDLFESYLKRRFGVKDAGFIVPGHGGMFDRVDGLMPAAMVLFITLSVL
jgi:phosphatidate cytidylyltransferase